MRGGPTPTPPTALADAPAPSPPSEHGEPPTGRLTDPGGPRRGRPPTRNEILRGDCLGGAAPEDLARRFGTPLYAYDLDVVEEQVAALRRALPPIADLAYAVKANPALAVISFLGELGLGADVASAGELAAARRAGVRGDRIVFTGPGKRNDELAAAIHAGVRAITVESPGELDRLERLAANRRARFPVLLRAAASEASRLERVRLVGDDGAGKFGMAEADLLAAARTASRSPHLDLLGIHRCGASNVLDASALAAHVAETVDIARAVAGAVGVTLHLVDVGGGLGIAYEPHQDSFDLAGFGRRLARLGEGWAADPATRDMRLLLEPGRFLVASAGAYLARVVDRKRVGEDELVILDGGVHHLLRPVLVGQEHRIRVLGARGRGGRAWPVTVAGPLCSGLDILAASAALPLPDVGDLVAVLDAGAYGFTESMPLFLSHPIPAEVAIRRGRAELIRPRQEPAEWLDRQRVPAW